MITHRDFQFTSYQAVAFYVGLQFATSKLLRPMLQALDNVLDGDPISLPVPPEAPPEIPRVVLTNKDGSLRFDLSLARADMRWQRPDQGEMPLEGFTELAQRAFESFHQAIQARPGRLALVVHRCKLEEQPGLALARHFCRPELLSNEPGRKGPLNRPEAFELHAFKRYEQGRFVLNSWVRSKSGTLTAPRGMQPIVLVEQDLNTPQENLAETQFTDGDVRDFHALCRGDLETILRVYFPAEGGA